MSKKYTVRYWEHNYIEQEIEADSKEEAESKMQDMVCSGEIDLSFAELDNCGYEVVDDDEVDEK